jgi:hypothetical protein
MKFSPSRVISWLILVVLALSAIIGTSCSHYNSCPVIESVQSQEDWVAPSGSIRVECIASDANGDTLTYTWLATGGKFSEQSSVSTWEAPVTPGEYTITALVTDGWGGEAVAHLNVAVVTVNKPPIIESLVAEPSVVDQDKSINIKCVATDPDGDALEYVWEVTAGHISGQDAAVTWQAPHALGAYTITVSVTDGQSPAVTKQLTVDVIENHPPVIESLTAEPQAILQDKTSEVKCLAYDPDGDELEYIWGASGGEFTGQGANVTWQAPTECDNYFITVTVADDRGGKVSEEVKIMVRKPG